MCPRRLAAAQGGIAQAEDRTLSPIPKAKSWVRPLWDRAPCCAARSFSEWFPSLKTRAGTSPHESQLTGSISAEIKLILPSGQETLRAQPHWGSPGLWLLQEAFPPSSSCRATLCCSSCTDHLQIGAACLGVSSFCFGFPGLHMCCVLPSPPSPSLLPTA